jgi:hypothetical protein
MRREDIVSRLCREAGESGTEAELVEAWEASHGCCCSLHVEKAASGEATVLANVRACMGLDR